MRRPLTALCTAALSLLLAATPASAQLATPPPEVTRSGCPRGSVCLYAERHLEGRMVRVRIPGQRLDFRAFDFNDQLSSWVNNSATSYCWFNDVNAEGTSHLMLPAVRANVLPRENDNASSLRRC